MPPAPESRETAPVRSPRRDRQVRIRIDRKVRAVKKLRNNARVLGHTRQDESMIRRALIFAITCAVAMLCGCGGKNGLVGGGQGNSLFIVSIAMTPLNPTITLTVSPQPPATA